VLSIPVSATLPGSWSEYRARGFYDGSSSARQRPAELETGTRRLLLVFNTPFVRLWLVILAIQPLAPLNPRGLGMLAPSTIFNTVASFMTNTNLQHYSGDVHFSTQSAVLRPGKFHLRRVGFCPRA